MIGIAVRKRVQIRMNVITTLSQFSIYAMESFIWWRLTKNVLQLKFSKKYLIGAAFLLFFLMLLKHFLFEIPQFEEYQTYGSLVVMIYTFTAGIILYKNSILEKLIWWGVYCFGLFAMELLAVLMLSLIFNKPLEQPSDQMSLIVIITTKFINVFVFEVIIHRRRGKLAVEFSYFRELALVVLFNILLLIGTVFTFINIEKINENVDNIILFFFGMILLITFFTIILIFKIEKKSQEEMATKLKLQQIELELKMNEDMIDISDKLRKLRHDMNNHIGLIKILAHTDKIEELKEYINQIYEDVEIANELVITGNKTLSVLLNAKKSQAKKKNIDFQSVISMPDIKMQNKDICALIGNILDNAIEAAEKAKAKKYIDLSIQKTEQGCVINCENSLDIKPVIKKGKFITTKENSVLHGIGMENIKDIVLKYKGEVHYEYDDEMFNIKVVMPV